eukprot:1195060-Prorocentrum_minimum.AAC.5
MQRALSMRAEACLGTPSVAGARLGRHGGLNTRAPPLPASRVRSHAFSRKRPVQFSRAVTTQAKTLTKDLEPSLQKIADQGFQLPEFDPAEVAKVAGTKDKFYERVQSIRVFVASLNREIHLDALYTLQSKAELKAAMGESSATDMELDWFIRDRSLDVADAEEKLKKYLEWRSEGFIGLNAESPEIVSELALKKAYLSKDPDVVRTLFCAQTATWVKG